MSNRIKIDFLWNHREICDDQIVYSAYRGLFAVAGCGGGGGGTGAESDTPAEVRISGPQASLYAEYAEDKSVSDDGVLTEDEIDCSDPLFTRAEPFPPAVGIPAGIDSIVSPQINRYLECADGVERYYTDGTFEGRITDSELFRWAHDFWNVCEVGTEPPDYRGNFGFFVSDLGFAICWRLDALPGLLVCRVVDPFVDEHGIGYVLSTSMAVHQGVPIAFDYDKEVCRLRLE